MFLSDGTIDNSLIYLWTSSPLPVERIQTHSREKRAFWKRTFKRLPDMPVRAADLPYVVFENGDLYSVLENGDLYDFLEVTKSSDPKLLTDVVDISDGAAVRKDGSVWKLNPPKPPERMLEVANVKAARLVHDNQARSLWMLRKDGGVYRKTGVEMKFRQLTEITRVVELQPIIEQGTGAAIMLLDDGTFMRCRGDTDAADCRPLTGVVSVAQPGVARPN
jgi:hypothetical protein